ncbi:Hypothetical protein FKW44_016220 [Caligus rogercresseyi]|uniref:Uncharacterized protein n=1 Tax=Caligus rogercresseyi TaxID=217165 RepID=A0A7T8K171_CALRO|nr:Hypothetical protein FKW44_016220 [Caligus rogercresseyi]
MYKWRRALKHHYPLLRWRNRRPRCTKNACEGFLTLYFYNLRWVGNPNTPLFGLAGPEN